MEENKKPVATEGQTRVQLEKTYKDEKLGCELTVTLVMEECPNRERVQKIMSNYLLLAKEMEVQRELERTFKNEELGYEVTISLKIEGDQSRDKVEKIMSNYLWLHRRFYLDFYRNCYKDFPNQ